MQVIVKVVKKAHRCLQVSDVMGNLRILMNERQRTCLTVRVWAIAAPPMPVHRRSFTMLRAQSGFPGIYRPLTIVLPAPMISRRPGAMKACTMPRYMQGCILVGAGTPSDVILADFVEWTALVGMHIKRHSSHRHRLYQDPSQLVLSLDHACRDLLS